MSEVAMGAQEVLEQMITPTMEEESSPDSPGHGTSIQEVELSLTDLQPWDRIQDLLLPLSNKEKELLKQSLLQDGPVVPIYVLPDGKIVDGYHRWNICREHGLTPRIEVLAVSEDDAVRIGLFLNIARRQVSIEQLQDLKREQKRIYLNFRKQGKTQEEASSCLAPGFLDTDKA